MTQVASTLGIDFLSAEDLCPSSFISDVLRPSRDLSRRRQGACRFTAAAASQGLGNKMNRSYILGCIGLYTYICPSI